MYYVSLNTDREQIMSEQTNWGIINMDTGDITPVDRMDGTPGRWDKVYGKQLANMLDAGGEDRARVIATLVRNKDMANFVHLTVTEIAEKSKVSTKTVHRTLKALEDKNYIHRIRNGKLMFSPHVINRGDTSMGLAVVTMWKQETES
jgi:DNA-binding transcriptional ArsR family regulator